MKTKPYSREADSEAMRRPTTEELLERDKAARKPAPAQAQHSPLPWAYGSHSREIYSRSNGAHVATLHISPLPKNLLRTREETQANAAFIVHACNNAQRLADALKELLGFLDRYPHPFAVDISGYISESDEAIAQWSKSNE